MTVLTLEEHISIIKLLPVMHSFLIDKKKKWSQAI